MKAAGRKISRGATQHGECVEFAALPGSIGVRDSKKPEDGRLIPTSEAFTRLVRRVKGLD